MSRLLDAMLHLHGWAALVVVFAVPALEASAFLGFLFPGEAAILLGGVLAYQGRISVGAAIAAAVAGAVIGDSIGYEIGKRHGRRILDGTVGRIVKAHHLDKASDYLRRRGATAVFFGRFTAALRVLIPGLAGMSGMPYRMFLAWNVAGGTIWATAFVLLGYLGGSSYRRLESAAKKASLLLFLLVVVIALTVWAARWVARHPDRLRAQADRVANLRFVAAVRSRYRRQLDFLVRRFKPEGALGLSLSVSLLLVAVTGWVFGTVFQDALSGESLDPLDRPVLHFLVRHREPWLNRIAELVTALGSSPLLVPLLAVVAAGYWWRRHTWRPAALFVTAYGGGVLVCTALKVLVGRPRPNLDLLVGPATKGLSFPSGHACQSMIGWGLLAAMAALASRSWPRKVAAWTVAGLITLLVGTSRVYLGTHWPTDVIGGWTLGALWLSAVLTLARTVPRLRGSTGTAGR